MKLFFLGTASAEGYPAPFCECINCSEASNNKATKRTMFFIFDGFNIIIIKPLLSSLRL